MLWTLFIFCLILAGVLSLLVVGSDSDKTGFHFPWASTVISVVLILVALTIALIRAGIIRPF